MLDNNENKAVQYGRVQYLLVVCWEERGRRGKLPNVGFLQGGLLFGAACFAQLTHLHRRIVAGAVGGVRNCTETA